MPHWVPSSWSAFSAQQQPVYAEEAQLVRVLTQIRQSPPLVSVAAIEALRVAIAEAAAGERFLLQGGDCAERFQDCTVSEVRTKLGILSQLALVLNTVTKKPVLTIGRIAGQYAKPRSLDMEQQAGMLPIPSFRGDNVNRRSLSWKARQADPRRLWVGHQCAAITHEHLRALCTSPFYTSHEGLLLPYEEAVTYQVPAYGRYYNLGAHFLWIGDRTRQLTGAHVEFFRGIANPIGIKLGPSVSPTELAQLLDILNPHRQQGRITLITRLGAHNVPTLLPPLIHAVQDADHSVLWVCDPMHGNGFIAETGYKTRDFTTICADLDRTDAVHRACGSRLGGLHIEVTGNAVTECIGGPEGIRLCDVPNNYQTYCDPRLNAVQSLALVSQLTSLSL